MVTRRCTQRMFLLRPDAACRDAFTYCLALAAQQTGVVVMMPVVMSNHHHTIVHDPEGRISEFTGYLHGLVARSMNATRGRWENFWSAESSGLLRLDDREAVMSLMVYAATNPVKDGLVAKVDEWPGVHGLHDLLEGRAVHVTRPATFFDPKGAMPEEATLRFEVPQGTMLGEPAAFLAELCTRVAEREAEIAAARDGAPVLGVQAVCDQSPRATPSSWSPRRKQRPTIAASGWSLVEALLRNRVFEVRYRTARLRWKAGLAAEFPPGTNWLRRFAHVTVADL